MIENEFGEVGVDNDIIETGDEQIVEMNNGCICCTVRGDLIRILGSLKEKRDEGKLRFDRVVIETTGMADPGPVAQTFFTDEEIGNYYLLGFDHHAGRCQARAEAARRVSRGAGAGGFRGPHPHVQDRSRFSGGERESLEEAEKNEPARADQEGALRRRAARRSARHPRLQPERDPAARPGSSSSTATTSTTTRWSRSCSSPTGLSTARSWSNSSRG